jgi:hypothetical protein
MTLSAGPDLSGASLTTGGVSVTILCMMVGSAFLGLLSRPHTITARTEAEVLALAIEIGALSVTDAVAWADNVIEREEHPDGSICEVAMSARKYEPDVVAALRKVPGKLDDGEVRRRLIHVLADGLEHHRRRADQIARSLYQLALTNQVDSERLRNIAWWAWDGLDLADARMVEQTREHVIDEMIAALREAAGHETPGGEAAQQRFAADVALAALAPRS